MSASTEPLNVTVRLPTEKTISVEVPRNISVSQLRHLVWEEADLETDYLERAYCLGLSEEELLEVEFVRFGNAHKTLTEWVQNNSPIEIGVYARKQAPRPYLQRTVEELDEEFAKTQKKRFRKTRRKGDYTVALELGGEVSLHFTANESKSYDIEVLSTLIKLRDQLLGVSDGSHFALAVPDDETEDLEEPAEGEGYNVEEYLKAKANPRRPVRVECTLQGDQTAAIGTRGAGNAAQLQAENEKLRKMLAEAGIGGGARTNRPYRSKRSQGSDQDFDVLGAVSDEEPDQGATDKYNVWVHVPHMERPFVMRVSNESTVAQFRAKVYRRFRQRGFLDRRSDLYRLQAVDAEAPIEDEEVAFSSLFPAQDGNYPSVQLVEVSAEKKEVGKEEKIMGVHISNTLGRPTWMTSQKPEVIGFRADVGGYLASQFDTGELSLATGLNNINGGIVDTEVPEYVKEKLLVRVHLGTGTKMLGASRDDDVDTLVIKALKKFLGQGATEEDDPQDFLLKVCGMKEYIDGRHQLKNVQFIRDCQKADKKIDLSLERRENLAPREDNPTHLVQSSESIRPRYKHSNIKSSKVHWSQMGTISMWEMREHFTIRILGVDNISLDTENLREAFEKTLSKKAAKDVFSSVQGYEVEAGLYHGGSLIAEPLVSHMSGNTVCPRWNEPLEFDIAMQNIPRATRICFTLFVTLAGKNTERFPVSWVNVNLIDYRSQLVSGVQQLNMWPDGPANPIGTCVANLKANNCPQLFVEFESYALPIVFPEYAGEKELANTVGDIASTEVSQEDARQLKVIINADPIYQLTDTDRELLWNNRGSLKSNPRALPKFLFAIDWTDPAQVHEAHRMLHEWAPMNPIEALELLDARFADASVREYAVNALNQLNDTEMDDLLLQLVQVAKYEPYHDSALVRFLLKRALNNRTVVGHTFFWHLKAEMHVPEISERYGLMLEMYLRLAGAHRESLIQQDKILKDFVTAAEFIKDYQVNERREVLREKLAKYDLPERFTLSLNAGLEVKGLLLDKCKSMDSKKVPLWLVFENADVHGDPIFIIFKAGDDLRQDLLTLQLIRIMDKVWQRDGLDLYMIPYGCVATGDEEGMIEVVLDSDTTANIVKAAGGASAAFKEDPLANWLREANPSDKQYDDAVELFMRSCAGYCVATYILGIGDRHNDNVMLKRNGQLFHIDFGHFLGNVKYKFGIKRERAPFVLTPDFAYVMGGRDHENFERFTQFCCDAYNSARRNAPMFFNLFAMMLSTGIPELQSVEDLRYLRDAFSLELSEEEASEKFRGLIDASLKTKATQINNAIHIIAHS